MYIIINLTNLSNDEPLSYLNITLYNNQRNTIGKAGDNICCKHFTVEINEVINKIIQ